MATGSLIRRAYDGSYGRLFAALYDRMLARAEERDLGRYRAEVVGRARGRTLEIGAGTGHNLLHYGPEVDELVLTEPFGPMAARLRHRLAELDLEAEVVEAPAERLPLGAAQFDSVVCTLVLCTVDDQASSLAEIARVLKPGASLLFVEHVRAETPGLARAQDLLHGPWYVIGHGCHCNRDTVAAIQRSPLELGALERGEMPGMPLVKPVVLGEAVAA
jgi:ubiquinone/menaquinone biosynthesis C-methylase UbiE